MVLNPLSTFAAWLNWRVQPQQQQPSEQPQPQPEPPQPKAQPESPSGSQQEPQPQPQPQSSPEPPRPAEPKPKSKPLPVSTETMSTGKRTTVLKTPTSLDPTISIGELASLTGANLIKVGRDSIVQSRAKLVSTYGPVTIGSFCILSEKCHIGLQRASTNQPDGVIIENHVIIEVNAVVEAIRVGEGSIVEVGAKVGKGSVIGKHCTIGPLCVVEENEVLPDYTVIYGTGQRRVDRSGVDEVKLKMVRLQVATLKTLLQSNIAKFL